jgi:hypothetical protein
MIKSLDLETTPGYELLGTDVCGDWRHYCPTSIDHLGNIALD